MHTFVISFAFCAHRETIVCDFNFCLSSKFSLFFFLRLHEVPFLTSLSRVYRLSIFCLLYIQLLCWCRCGVERGSRTDFLLHRRHVWDYDRVFVVQFAFPKHGTEPFNVSCVLHLFESGTVSEHESEHTPWSRILTCQSDSTPTYNTDIHGFVHTLREAAFFRCLVLTLLFLSPILSSHRMLKMRIVNLFEVIVLGYFRSTRSCFEQTCPAGQSAMIIEAKLWLFWTMLTDGINTVRYKHTHCMVSLTNFLWDLLYTSARQNAMAIFMCWALR